MFASAPYHGPGRYDGGGGSPMASAPPRLQGGLPGIASIGGGGGSDVQSSRGNFTYAGEGRGGYIQECKYKYVGDGGGEFEMITVKKKRPNYTLCFGLLFSGVIIALLGYTSLPHGVTEDILGRDASEQKNSTAEDGAGLDGLPRFSCEPDGLDHGERVRAAADIAFEPGGFVQEGALGSVVVDDPQGVTIGHGGADERVVIVSWDGIPGLKNARVTRDMLIRVMDVDDELEATLDMEYKMQNNLKPLAKLDVADLVRATQDLGGVKKGTYGTIVAVSQENSAEFSDDVASKLEAGRAVVRFVNQLDTVKVREGHIQKAPQVGDHVRARADLGGATAGKAAVPRGTIGIVTAVTPAEDGFSFRFTVDWEGHPRADASGEELETLIPPDGSLVHKGTKGTVIGSTSDRMFIIDWEGLSGPGAEVDRSHLRKTDTWSVEKKEWCCSQGKHCDSGSGGSVGATPVPSSAANPFKCKEGQPEAWSVDKATWCCEHESVGCAAPSAAAPSKSTAPALRQRQVPASFDPAPRTFVSTSRPALPGIV